MKINVGKKYDTQIANFRSELQPNGRVVECINDMKNGYLIIKLNDNTAHNIWLAKLKIN